jgi:hypothetical protein
VTAHERRAISRALRDLELGQQDTALASLRRLAGEDTPRAVPSYVTMVGPGGTLRPARVMDAVPQPKPRKRIVDRKAMLAYRESHPHCEVIGCVEPPCPEPHHLISRKMKGDDVPSNFLRLCQPHHSEWHRGPATWAQLHIHQLTAEARSKVMTALRYEGE